MTNPTHIGMRYDRYRFAAVFIAVIISTSSVLAATYDRPPFIYQISRAEDRMVANLDKELRRRVRPMEDSLGGRLAAPIKIVLTLTPAEFAEITRGGVPAWAGGVAYPGQKRVVVKTPLFFNEGVPLEVLTAHELAHLSIYQAAAGQEIPRWLDEGLAMVASGEARQGSLSQLARAAAGDRLMGLPRVDWVLGFSRPDAELAYAEARSAAQYLIEQIGWSGIRKLLSGVTQGREFAPVFREVTGAEYEVWQVDWLDYARNRYRSAVLLDVDNLIWIVIFLLGAVAVITVYIRRRIQFRRWLQEEDDELGNSDEPIHPE